ncbi:MAG: rod shape-determining protein MreD [Deltaproteobacteria bacterium]|nr:rod shape-determining protein MreD [Deltaproteobacteria bacterium]
MNILIIWFVSIFFLLVKGNLFHSLIVKGVDIDLIVVFTVYFLASNESSPVFFAFCQGFLLDILSGGMMGFFTLLYLLVYFCIRFASHPIDLLTPVGRAAVVFIAVIIKEMMMLLFLSLFSPRYLFSMDLLLSFFLSALLTSVLSIFIFHFLKISSAVVTSVEGDF